MHRKTLLPESFFISVVLRLLSFLVANDAETTKKGANFRARQEVSSMFVIHCLQIHTIQLSFSRDVCLLKKHGPLF